MWTLKVARLKQYAGDIVGTMARRGCRSFIAFLTLALTAGVSGAAGQQNKSSDATSAGIPKITVNAQEVLVPVVVTDKKGHHVTSLKASDFDVFEDGVKQKVVAFSKTFDPGASLVESPNRAAGNSTAAPVIKPADAPMRTYLVCVDSIHSSFANWGRARAALSKFFAGEQDSEAQYALINLARRLEVIQDSTRDRSAVLNALRSKRFQASILDSEASNIAYEKEQLKYMLQSLSPSACINAPSVRVRGQIPDNCSTMKQRVRAFINGSAERTAVLTRAFIQELNAVVDALASMPTTHTLVLISDGFNLVPGQELYGIAAAYFPDVAEFRSNYRETQAELDTVLRKGGKEQRGCVRARFTRAVLARIGGQRFQRSQFVSGQHAHRYGSQRDGQPGKANRMGERKYDGSARGGNGRLLFSRQQRFVDRSPASF